MNVVSFLIQAFVVSRAIERLGIRRALFVMPVIALGAYGAIAVIGGFALVRAAKVAENSTEYSLDNTVRQTLFLPTDRAAKYKAKAAIDTFAVRAGDTVSALVIWIGVRQIGLRRRQLAAINVVLVLVWFAVAFGISRAARRLQRGDARRRKMRTQRVTSLAIVMVALASVACSSTRTATIEHAWRDPNARVGELTNVVTLFPTRDAMLRRTVEDKLAQHLADRGVRAVPGYTVLTRDDVQDRNVAGEILRRAGFDGLVAMRVVEADRTLEYYPAFDVYWGAAWGTVVPGAIIRMQVDAYSLADRRLVWSAVSRSVDPNSIGQLVDDITAVVSRELSKERVVVGKR